MPVQKGLSDELILRAVVRHGGQAGPAGRELGCTPQNVGARLKRLDLSAGYDHAETTRRVRAYLAEVDRKATLATRMVKPETVTTPARCHPDRQEYQLGLCRDCYRERRERSMTLPPPTRKVDPNITAQLEGLDRHIRDLAPTGSPPRAWQRDEVPVARPRDEAARRGARPANLRRYPALGALTEAEFETLEAMMTGLSDADVAQTAGVPVEVVQERLKSVLAKTKTTNIVGAYHAIGWLRPDYEETMTGSFLSLLERLDGAIHEAMTAARRGRE